MIDILLISPALSYPTGSYPFNQTSDSDIDLRDREWVVNLGLLSVATYLNNKGLSVKILDLVASPNHLDELLNLIEAYKPKMVGFSAVSCYSYLNIALYCSSIRSIAPNIYLFGGGQHLSAIPLTALKEVPELECVICGEGEEGALQVAKHRMNGKPPIGVASTVIRLNEQIVDQRYLRTKPLDLNEIGYLNYKLLPNFKLYCPEIEFSRGCPWSCHFCTDPMMFNNRVRYKDVNRFLDELEHIISTYEMDPEEMRVYFTCSTFGLKRDRIVHLTNEMVRRRLRVSWRTETRVDSPTIKYIGELAKAGLCVLDLGLESASPTMLRRMNKTNKDPERYLVQAEQFITRVAESENVTLKINILNHAGETPDTLSETLSFLFKHRSGIDHISAGPVIMYPGTELADNFERYAVQFGTSYVKGSFWDQVHAYKVNPSHDLSFEQLNVLSTILCKMINSEESYFTVKAHGQLPLGTTFEDWKEGNREFSPSTRLHPIGEYSPGGSTVRSPFAQLPDFVSRAK